MVRALIRRGHSVVAIDRHFAPDWGLCNGVTIVELNVWDFEGLGKSLGGCDGLIHLAAIPGPGRQHDIEVHNNNVVGSYNAMRAAVEVGIARVCQASSVNSIGAAFSRAPRFDYFPVDTGHPSYNEDPYSLSKWICEQQADSIARRYDISLTSLRIHMVASSEEAARSLTKANPELGIKHLWGWTSLWSAAAACCLAVESYDRGHRVLFVVSPRHVGQGSAEELIQGYYPDVTLRRPIEGDDGFFDCSDAERLLGWRHDDFVVTVDNQRG